MHMSTRIELKKDNPSQRNCQNLLSHPDLSHTEQECQESLIQEKICNQQNLNEGLTIQVEYCTKCAFLFHSL